MHEMGYFLEYHLPSLEAEALATEIHPQGTRVWWTWAVPASRGTQIYR